MSIMILMAMIDTPDSHNDDGNGNNCYSKQKG